MSKLLHKTFTMAFISFAINNGTCRRKNTFKSILINCLPDKIAALDNILGDILLMEYFYVKIKSAALIP